MNLELIERIFVESGGRMVRDNAGNILTYSEECDPYVFARNIVLECTNHLSKCGFEQALLNHFQVDK
jgi:hypothetical protein